VLLEAHVVNLRDAAAQGSKGLLQPLLKRYQVGAAPAAPAGRVWEGPLAGALEGPGNWGATAAA
jgi:hypothetical protein